MTDASERTADPPSSPLDRRRADVAALVAGPWDVVIIGGGIVGCGAFLDAVSRGLRVALVDGSSPSRRRTP